MKSNSSASPGASRPRVKWGLGLWLLALGFPGAAIAADALLRHTALPVWARVVVALLPLVPAGFFLRAQRRALANADELGLHVAREAFGFVFFAQIGLFVCVDLLENAGVLPGFAWTTGKLVIAMMLLALLGVWLASRRYR